MGNTLKGKCILKIMIVKNEYKRNDSKYLYNVRYLQKR